MYSITIFLIAALEWLAAVEMSSSASVTHQEKDVRIQFYTIAKTSAD